MKQQIVILLLDQYVLNPKDKSKTVGVARQQRHFLCGDKENEAKENLARRLACLARYHGNVNLQKTGDSLSTDSP